VAAVVAAKLLERLSPQPEPARPAGEAS